jgi:Tol biopolymer transport system component
MDTRKDCKSDYSKAWVALVAAVSCLVIYILACVRSPVSWSPDLSKIAILVTPAGDEPEKFGVFTYDLATGQRVLLDEVGKGGYLSGPAWSPDGEWIAYYRVEPPVEDDPNADPNVSSAKAGEAAESGGGTLPASIKLFSEENAMLPPFAFGLLEEKMDGEEDEETFDVKLMVVKPDGQGRKTLQVIEWLGDEDAQKQIMLIRPEWAPGSDRIFYVRMLSETFYVGSLDISSGQAQAHLFSIIGIPAVSPDGKWVASLSPHPSEDFVLNLARVDGSVHKYFKLDVEGGNGSGDDAPISLTWSPDSRKVWMWAKEAFIAVDTDTGGAERYSDPNGGEGAYWRVSLDGDKLYYLAGQKTEDPNAEGRVMFKSMHVASRKAETVFEFDFKEVVGSNEEVGWFHISPDGKVVLLRTAVDDEETVDDQLALVFWDGKTRKVVKTGRWLMKPVFKEEHLGFEERLLRKWEGKDGVVVLFERAEGDVYRITVSGEVEEHDLGASLFRVGNLTFLGMFKDEALARTKDRYGSHLLPDTIVRVDQIEPKLLFDAMEYEDVELLIRDPNSLEQKKEGEDYSFEGTRVK